MTRFESGLGASGRTPFGSNLNGVQTGLDPTPFGAVTPKGKTQTGLGPRMGFFQAGGNRGLSGANCRPSYYSICSEGEY